LPAGPAEIPDEKDTGNIFHYFPHFCIGNRPRTPKKHAKKPQLADAGLILHWTSAKESV